MPSGKSKTSHWISTNFEYLWTVNQQCFLDGWAELQRIGGASLTMKAAACCYRITKYYKGMIQHLLIIDRRVVLPSMILLQYPGNPQSLPGGMLNVAHGWPSLICSFSKVWSRTNNLSIWITLDHWMDDATILHAHRREVLLCFASAQGAARNWRWDKVSWGDYPPHITRSRHVTRAYDMDPASQFMGDMKVSKHCLQLKLQGFCATCPINECVIQ